MKSFVFGLIKKGIKQKTTGKEVVNPFKFKPAKNKLERTIRDVNISVDKAKGRMKRNFQKMEEVSWKLLKILIILLKKKNQ